MDSTPWYNLGGISSHPCSGLHGFGYYVQVLFGSFEDVTNILLIIPFHCLMVVNFCILSFQQHPFTRCPIFLPNNDDHFLIVMCSTPSQSFSCKAVNHWLYSTYIPFLPFLLQTPPQMVGDVHVAFILLDDTIS